MKDWLPISREDVVVRGADPLSPQQLDVSIPLSRVPEAEWRACFLNPVGIDKPESLFPPQLVGSTIEVQVPYDEFEACLRYIDACIVGANHRYEIEIIPRLIHEEALRAAEEAEQRARVDEARDQAKRI
jgi:hypothetical protein